MTETKKIRILIADDFKTLRDVIRLYLDRTSDMDVVGEAPELHEAVEGAKAMQPDVILVNDYLPPVDAALASTLFRKEGISAAILSISLKADPDLVRRGLRNGVNGFLEKDEIPDLLVKAIRSVCRGERYLSPGIKKVYDDE
jgi:DNA-binding NarL/FixJ family response regulator